MDKSEKVVVFGSGKCTSGGEDSALRTSDSNKAIRRGCKKLTNQRS